MQKTINEYGKPIYLDVDRLTEFDKLEFHLVEYSSDDDIQYALHTAIGSLTVLNRMTGFGFRDIETGFRAPDGNFWLASGNFDVRTHKPKTLGEAIDLVKQHANTRIPKEKTDTCKPIEEDNMFEAEEDLTNLGTIHIHNKRGKEVICTCTDPFWASNIVEALNKFCNPSELDEEEQ